jgi:pseudouridylate synthase
MVDDSYKTLIAPDVAEALHDGRGVVALESTLIAHGLPWPVNLETARDAEAAVRASGAVPATIAVLGGTVRIGLDLDELHRISSAAGAFLKASRRDLGYFLARGLDAATTISSTLWLARRAGIHVMATGGLGGVHRGAAESFDVSTDLDELARADGALLVCSGVKSILDIPATLEVLEARGVPVLGYRVDEFPAFTTRTSGIRLEARVDSPQEAASVVLSHRALRLPCAIVLAQAVSEHAALDRAEMETALADALREADKRGIAGKAVTPFLLEQIREATEGRSLIANRALVVANAGLAGAVASEIARSAEG